MNLQPRISGTEIVTGLFGPPFRGLSLCVLTYFIACFALHPQNPIWQYNFVDNDDYLYLTQALDQIHGQSWFDGLQHRMNPPTGTYIHFSHILSGLYALTIGLLAPWLGTMKASLAVAAFFPLVFFAGLLSVARWAAAPFVGPEWEQLSSFIILFCLSLLLQFTPGHVDHHGLEALLALLAFGGAARLIHTPDDWRMACLTGGVLALGLALGLEILPILLVIGGVLGLWAASEGARAARAGLIFGAVLAVTCIFLLVLTKSPQQLFEMNGASFSITYVILTSGMALGFAAVALVTACRSLSRALHWMILVTVTAFIGASFLLFFPELITGPYGDADQTVVALIMRRSLEAWPLLAGGGVFSRSLALPALALVVALLFLRERSREQRWHLALLTILIASTYALAIFYQRRMMVFAEAFSVIPLTLALKHIWIWSAGFEDKAQTRLTRIIALLVVGPLSVIILPALGGGYENLTDLVLFPVQFTTKSCDHNSLVTTLNARYGDRPRLIMNGMNDSAEILYRTPHEILAAPFHMNVSGNIDAYHFFSATDPDTARSIAENRKADLVVLCKNLELIYKTPSGEANPALFAQQLVDGRIPAWLQPVEGGKLGNILLFEIKPHIATAPRPN